MVPVIYPVIRFVIRIIFAKESGIKRLKTQAYLLNNPYKIRVILAVRIYGNKVTYYFRVQGPFQIRDFKVIWLRRSIAFH